MQAGTVDPKELEISPEMQAKRDKIDVKNLGIGLFVSNSFFAWGFIVAKIWSKLVPSVSIHAYAWMIITVAICKIFNLLPENIEVACYQWFQFVMKNLTTTLLVGIGLCYLSLDTVIESFSVTYLILCLVTCVGAFFGAAIVGKVGRLLSGRGRYHRRAVHGEYGRHRRRSGSFRGGPHGAHALCADLVPSRRRNHPDHRQPAALYAWFAAVTAA